MGLIGFAALLAMGVGIRGLYSKDAERVRTYRRWLVASYGILVAVVLVGGVLLS